MSSQSLSGLLCPSCTECFDSVEALTAHAASCTRTANAQPPTDEDAPESKTVTCPSCEMVFPSPAQLGRHFPQCARASNYFGNTSVDATQTPSGQSDPAEWVDVGAEDLTPPIHEGMLAIRDKVFIIQQWRLFWVVLDRASISWFMNNKQRGQIQCSDIEVVEAVADDEKLSPPYKSSLFARTSPSGAHSALRLVKHDGSVVVLVAPTSAAREQWIRAVREVQDLESQLDAQRILNELQADLSQIRNPTGCRSFEGYVSLLKQATTPAAAKLALLALSTYLRQYRKIVKSKTNAQLAAVAKLRNMQQSAAPTSQSARSDRPASLRKWDVFVGGFKFTWPHPDVRIKEACQNVFKSQPMEWKRVLQPLFQEALSIARSLPSHGIAVRTPIHAHEDTEVESQGRATTASRTTSDAESAATSSSVSSSNQGASSISSVSCVSADEAIRPLEAFESQFVLLEEIGRGVCIYCAAALH